MTKSAQDAAETLADYDRRLKALERGPRLKNASMHDATIPIYDLDLTVRQTVGKQPDGTYTVVDSNGPPPPVPSLPTIEARPGTLVITWDGTFAGGATPPADWDHVEVHVSIMSGYTPTDTTEVITFHSLKGGSVTLALDEVPQYVILQAVSTSRTESPPTVEVTGTPLPPTTGPGGVQTFLEDEPPVGLDAADDGALWYDTNDGNHPHRWNGTTLAWVSIRDAAIATAAAAASTAQTAAAAALTAAEAAQATADGSIRTFYQSAAPWANGSSQPAEVVGDLWFDVDDGQAYRWSGTTWVIIEDNSIAAALAAAQTAQTTADGKITSYYQTSIPVVGELGDLWYDTNDQNKPYYCSSIAPLTWTSLRDGTIADVAVQAAQALADAAAAQAAADAAAAAANSDGLAPTASPDPVVLAGIESMQVRWDPITNADPVTYDVHVSTVLGFTPGPTTLVASDPGSQIYIRRLPGPDPAPGAADPRELQYDTPYYVRIIARDEDGPAAASAQAVGSIFQITGIHLAVDSVTAAAIMAGTLVGELFAGVVFLGSTFKTAETGQRVEWGVAGIQGYKPDGSLMLNFPTDGSDALIDAEVVARGLTVLGGASFQSSMNEVTKDSAFTWMQGIASPSAAPTLSISYDTLRPDTAALLPAWKTGTLGTFDLVPAEVSHIEWKAASGGYWVFNQIRANGTRSWFFNPDGTPKDIFGTNHYFNDQADWERWSTTEITSGAKAGVYTIYRSIPGVGTDWYISGPTGLNRYNRLNTSGAPALGNNGTDFFIAEVVGSQLRINYHLMTPWSSGPVPFLPAASTSYASTTGFATALCHCEWSSAGFDFGSGRYVTAERGVAYSARTIVTSGTGAGSLYPGPPGTPWSPLGGTFIESWESPTSNRRGMGWDGTNFWTYGADGYLYKHTSERWDTTVFSSTWWAKTTFRDSVGGFETNPPTLTRSILVPRRANVLVGMPDVPHNGAGDPDKGRLYMARGASQPLDTALRLQAEIAYTTVPNVYRFTSLATATAAPPVTNTFPGANPAIGKSAALATDGSPRFWFDGAGGGRWQAETWRAVGAVGQPAFGGTWSNIGGALAPLRFLKDRAENVWIIGQIKNSTGSGIGLFFTLPAGYIPEYDVPFTASKVLTGTSPFKCLVRGRTTAGTSGQVIIEANSTYTALDRVDLCVMFPMR